MYLYEEAKSNKIFYGLNGSNYRIGGLQKKLS